MAGPYSINVNKRPLRIAFIIDNKPESLPIINSIFADNRARWGGRYNPVIITDGQTLSNEWLNFLEIIDPDIVKSFVTLNSEVISRIERHVSPYIIEQPNPREQEAGYCRLELKYPGMSVFPTPTNIKTCSDNISDSVLILFKTCATSDKLIQKFIEWNYGVYSNPVYHVARALERIQNKVFDITDVESLITSLTELSKINNYTFPIQLCSIPKETIPRLQYDPHQETFHVIIGDTPADIAYFWNRPTYNQQYIRTFIKQIWIPLDLATNPQLTAVLSSLLHRCADPYGSGQGKIRFVSFSMDETQLNEIVEPLRCNLRANIEVDTLNEIQLPKFYKGSIYHIGQQPIESFRVATINEQLKINEPEIFSDYNSGEYWMADLHIEYRPKRYTTISGRKLWWQLPRLNIITKNFFKSPSRILGTHFPTIFMKCGVPLLEISIPDDLSIFKMLAVFPNTLRRTSDTESFSYRTSYSFAELSEKGQYLSGLLDIFDGLHPATSILEKRYWRHMFHLLSGRNTIKDEKQLQAVKNKLNKIRLRNAPQFFKSNESIDCLSHYVLDLARIQSKPSRDLRFSFFEEHAIKEFEEYNKSQEVNNQLEYSKRDLLKALADLVENRVLLMGIKSRCPSCGYREWYQIDEVKQILYCRGCHYKYPIEPEQEWHYRLNSLVEATLSEHGLLPVVLTLGQLLKDAKSAFFFTPCLDIYEDYDNGPVGDIDIAVVLDGKFVIGEVKQSRDLFDIATFSKMEEIAKRLLPDVLLFASMDREQSVLIRKEIERLSEELRPWRIDVYWYQLHEYKFNPIPYF